MYKIFQVKKHILPTIKKIQIYDNSIKFSLKALETFFEKWRGRPAITIFTSQSYYYSGKDYKKLINKYKNDGVIKDFFLP